MRRLALLLLLGILILPHSGCQMGITVTPLGPPGETYEAVSPDSLFQFSGRDRVLVAFKPIARLEFPDDFGLGGSEFAMASEEELLEKAGALGAHGIVWDSPAEATAIRFIQGGPRQAAPDRAAIKTAVDAEIAAPIRSGPGRQPPTGPEPWRQTVRSHHAVRTLGVASLAIPQDLPVPDSVLAVCTTTLFAELQAAGYDVFPLDETENADHTFDAVLFPDIEPVEAYFYGDRAQWDGVSRKVGDTRSTGAKVFSGILNALIRGGSDSGDEFDKEDNTPEGWVWAISLVVTMENSIGANLYSGRGGIELLEKADFEGGIYIGDPGPEEYELEEVPEEQLFTRTGRWRRAVGIALEGLGWG